MGNNPSVLKPKPISKSNSPNKVMLGTILFLSFFFSNVNAQQTYISVCSSGCNSTTIQYGISLSSSSGYKDVVIADNGIYNENLIINVTGLNLTSNVTAYPTINATVVPTDEYFMLINKSDVSISNIRIHYNLSTSKVAIFAGYSIGGKHYSVGNITLTNMEIMSASGDGIIFAEVSNSTIDGLNITVTGSSINGIYINGGGFTNITVSNSRIVNTGSNTYSLNYYPASFSAGIYARTTNNVTIINSTIDCENSFPLFVAFTRTRSVSSVKTSDGKPILYYDSSAVISGRSDIGQLIVAGNNVTVYNNTFSDYGLLISYGNSTNVSFNTFNVSHYAAIHAINNYYSRYTNNSFTSSNNIASILLNTDLYGIFENNTINNTEYSGCMEQRGCYGSIFRNNKYIINHASTKCIKETGVGTNNVAILWEGEDYYTRYTSSDFMYSEAQKNVIYRNIHLVGGGGVNGPLWYVEGTNINGTIDNINMTIDNYGDGGDSGIIFSNSDSNMTLQNSNITFLGYYYSPTVSPVRISATYIVLNTSIINCNIVSTNTSAITLGGKNNYTKIINSTLIFNATSGAIYGASTYYGITYVINTSYNKSIVFGSDAKDVIYNQYYLTVIVKDMVSNPLYGATVIINDSIGVSNKANPTNTQVLTTDFNGNTNTILTEFLANTTFNNTDRYLYFSNYIIQVVKDGYVTSYSTVNMTESKSVTVNLKTDGGIDYYMNYITSIANITNSNLGLGSDIHAYATYRFTQIDASDSTTNYTNALGIFSSTYLWIPIAAVLIIAAAAGLVFVALKGGDINIGVSELVVVAIIIIVGILILATGESLLSQLKTSSYDNNTYYITSEDLGAVTGVPVTKTAAHGSMVPNSDVLVIMNTTSGESITLVRG